MPSPVHRDHQDLVPQHQVESVDLGSGQALAGVFQQGGPLVASVSMENCQVTVANRPVFL